MIIAYKTFRNVAVTDISFWDKVDLNAHENYSQTILVEKQPETQMLRFDIELDFMTRSRHFHYKNAQYHCNYSEHIGSPKALYMHPTFGVC